VELVDLIIRARKGERDLKKYRKTDPGAQPWKKGIAVSPILALELDEGNQGKRSKDLF